jgi:hypothetical protein
MSAVSHTRACIAGGEVLTLHDLRGFLEAVEDFDPNSVVAMPSAREITVTEQDVLSTSKYRPIT